MKKAMSRVLKSFCPHFWDYRGHEHRTCRWCGKKEIIRPFTEIIPGGIGCLSVCVMKTNRWEKE